MFSYMGALKFILPSWHSQCDVIIARNHALESSHNNLLSFVYTAAGDYEDLSAHDHGRR